MNKLFLLLFFMVVFSLGSCKKDTLDFASSYGTHAVIPVAVADVYIVHNGIPVVATSVGGGGVITIKLDIPTTSGRTIKEITRVSFANTPSNYAIIQNPNATYSTPNPPNTGPYSTTPIPGSGISVTFTTSLSDYAAITKSTLVTAGGTATSFLGRYLYFLITLDNGEQLIPVPVRVYVNP